MVSESVATSTTFARNICTISSTWLRVPASARTLMSITWRCTADCGSSSTTLSTSTSLLSCLVTCSSGRSSTSTTTVIRDTSRYSVSPTASESMLKPRRENRAAIRARTPGLFSTRTDRVCLDMDMPPSALVGARRDPVVVGVEALLDGLGLLAVPLGCLVAGHLDQVVADTGRHHRPHHGVTVHDEVDDHRAVGDGHRRPDRVVHVLRALA